MNIFFYKIKQKIDLFLHPRQRWFVKKLPKDWIDLDTFCEISVFERFKYLVEEEKYFEYSVLDDSIEGVRNKTAKRMYEILIKDLPEVEKEIDLAWKEYRVDKSNPGLDERIDKLETKISQIKTVILLWIVENREFLWI